MDCTLEYIVIDTVADIVAGTETPMEQIDIVVGSSVDRLGRIE